MLRDLGLSGTETQVPETASKHARSRKAGRAEPVLSSEPAFLGELLALMEG